VQWFNFDTACSDISLDVAVLHKLVFWGIKTICASLPDLF